MHLFGFLAAAAGRDRKGCSALVAAAVRLADRVVVVDPSRRGCSGLLVGFGRCCAGGAQDPARGGCTLLTRWFASQLGARQ